MSGDTLGIRRCRMVSVEYLAERRGNRWVSE